MAKNNLTNVIQLAEQVLLETIGEMEKKNNAHSEATTQIMDDLLRDLEASFMSMGLTEEQESTLSKAIEGAIEMTSGMAEQNAITDKVMLDAVVGVLRGAMQ
jgi:hypothetical protein